VTKKIIGVVGAVIIIVLIVIFVGNNGKSTLSDNKKIIIGAVVSQTGYAAVDGMNIKNGMDLAVADLKKDGIDVKIVYEDDGTDPKQTVSAVNKLLMSEKPDALVGPIWSFLIDAALPVINQNKIVTFVPSASSEVVNGKSPYIFYGTYKNIEEAVPLANFLKENKVKNVALVVSNDAWGESHIKGFTKAVEIAGGKVVMEEKITYGSDKDVMPTIVAKIIKANPDAVLWTGYDEAATILTKRLQEQNYTKPLVTAASIMRGLVNRGIVNPRPEDQWYSINIPMNESFRAKYIATYNQEPGISADSAYDGVIMLVKGIQKGKKGDDLAKYLRDGLTYKGYLGNYDFDEFGDIVGNNWVIKKLVK
jgi:branched-chain amino acid transport system substrate-binding protein